MDKPISVKRKELSEKLIAIANSETLPAILMVDIFQQVTDAVSRMAEYQSKKEEAEYNAWLSSAHEKGEVNGEN